MDRLGKHLHHGLKEVKVRVGIFVVSTSRFNQIERGMSPDDPSGEMARELFVKEGHVVVFKEIIKDGVLSVKNSLFSAVNRDLDVILFIGGTGVSKTDLTIEAVKSFLDKTLEGFGELFRKLSYEEIGTASFLSRTLMGILEKKLIICLPGSTNAVKLALEKLVLPELSHVIGLARRK